MENHGTTENFKQKLNFISRKKYIYIRKMLSLLKKVDWATSTITSTRNLYLEVIIFTGLYIIHMDACRSKPSRLNNIIY